MKKVMLPREVLAMVVEMLTEKEDLAAAGRVSSEWAAAVAVVVAKRRIRAKIYVRS